MYLSKLDIFGFKSFARKTEIQFHDGITSIVGPNGCGKSNVVDAIRWVLGEQKAGSLRSENMQNVIFNGTKAHKPLGMAEVSLTIENNRNILPIQFSEVVITRRLFRSGESQYLLNNAACRLKDIVDLFMDTGMGANAYSVIELNMVEKILNGKPEERRQIFEEAAGVTKYKLRRKAAFRKLEATEQDLIRLSDILSEVEKNVSSLRRQVSKAEKYRDMTDELRQLELDYSAFQLATLHKELAPLVLAARDTTLRREELSRQLASEEAGSEKQRLLVLEVERDLYTKRADMTANSQRIQQKEEEILVSQERSTAAEQTRQRAKIEIDDLRTRAATLAEEKRDLGTTLAAAQADLAVAGELLRDGQAALQKIQNVYAEKRVLGQAFDEARLRKREDMVNIRQEEERLRTQIAFNSRQIENLEDEDNRVKQTEREMMAKAKELTAQNKIQRDEIEAMDEELAVNNRDIGAARDAIEKNKNDLLVLQGQIQSRRDRSALLRKFVETYEDYPEGVRHLLLDKVLPEGTNLFGTVGEVISVSERYRKAIEVALGENAVSVIIDNTPLAFSAIDLLRSSRKGAVTFLPLDRFAGAKTNGSQQAALDAGRGVHGWASSLVKVAPQYRDVIAGLLNEVLVVENLAAANDLVADFAEKRIALVTLDGEIVYSWGPIRGGETADNDANLVGRRAIIDELESEIVDLQQQYSEKKNNLEINERRLQELLQIRDQLEKARETKSTSVQTIEIALGKAQLDWQRANERIKILQDEKDALLDELAQAEAHLGDLSPLLAASESQKRDSDSDYDAYRQELGALEAEVKQHEEKVQKVHLEYVSKEAGLKNLEQTRERLERTGQEIDLAVRRREEEIITATKRIDELMARIEEIRVQLQNDFAERKELEDVVDAIEKQYKTQKEEIEAREKVLREIRNKRDEVAEKLHQMELRISELKMNEKSLLDHIRETYEIDLKEQPAPQELDVEPVQNRLNDLKQRLRAIGLVNMLALKDYEVEKERLDFLTAQKKDLLTAEENLKETIKVINTTAYERFNAIFSQVRENFIQVFRGFFESGIADLRLDSDDPLEADIIVEASPKGRKLGSLALLSGGEKTLTAISLLFAIYLVKPSPFCILDEVDAPLDDANIGRFTNALAKFSDRTQFIVVTHNKLTMSAANQLYGITMEEPGVSKVVSVKMENRKDASAVQTTVEKS